MPTKHALITGGAGFIGSHLTELLLKEGHRVTVIDNFSTGRPQNLEHLQSHPKLTVIQADVSDIDAIRPHFTGIEWVFHMAALADIVPSIQRPLEYYNSNVTGTVSVLEAARGAGVKRFIYTASSSCYGIPDTYPTSELSPARPQYPYALTKYLGEECVLHWGQLYHLPVVSLRLFNVYGPRSRTSGTYGAVFGVFLAQKLAGKPYTVVGDGTQTRDFTFVADVARAFLMAAESDVSQEVMNVGTGKPQSVNRLVELLGGDVTYIPKRPGEPDCTHADTSKIQKLLNWKPQVSFEEGVAIMIKNIEYWKEAPLWTPEKIADATKEWFTYLSPHP
jgi:UDP-glucose 4-epimerase